MHEQAARKISKPMTYRSIDMWFSSEKSVLSLARLSDQLLMIGEPNTLERAIDRTINDSKNYSPLLKGARREIRAKRPMGGRVATSGRPGKPLRPFGYGSAKL